jgi:hypothetical protein
MTLTQVMGRSWGRSTDTDPPGFGGVHRPDCLTTQRWFPTWSSRSASAGHTLPNYLVGVKTTPGSAPNAPGRLAKKG